MNRQRFSPLLSVAALASSLVLSGCAGVLSAPLQTPDAVSAPAVVADDAELVVDAGFSDENLFVLRSLEAGRHDVPAGLPAVKNLSVSANTVGDALRLMAASAGLHLVYEDAQLQGPVLRNVSGEFAQVLNTLAQAYGLTWDVEGRQLTVARNAQYLVQLPSMLSAETLDSTTNMLKQLGATQVYLNKNDATVALRADTNTAKKLNAYLQHLRTTRSMIVYDVDVWQVNLTAERKQGLDWTTLAWTYGGASAGGSVSLMNAATPAGAGVG